MQTPLRFFRSALCATLAIQLLGLAPGGISRAVAQPADAKTDAAPPTAEQLEQAKQAFAAGRQLYEAGDKAGAVEKFKESYRLSRNPVLLYNVALTLDELKQLDLALFYYEKFLKDAPASAAQRGEANKRLKTLRKEVEAAAKAAAAADKEKAAAAGTATAGTAPAGTAPAGTAPAGTAPTGTAPAGTAPTGAAGTGTAGTGTAATGAAGAAGAATGAAAGTGAAVATGTGEATAAGTGEATAAPAGDAAPEGKKGKADAFMHKVVDETPPGKPLDITAVIPEDSGWQVTLFYRAAGEDKFASASMRARYNELVGRIPASKTKQATLQYYIEAKDRNGKIVGRSGKSSSPNLVFVEATAKARFYPDLDESDLDMSNAPSEEPKLVYVGPKDGFTDVGSTKFRYIKLGSTAVAGIALGLAVGGYISASNAGSTIESEAARSHEENCPAVGGQPCVAFSDEQKDYQSYGQRWETITNVALVTGVVATGVAAYYWYREIKEKKDGRPVPGTAFVTPVVGEGFVGGTAELRF